MKQILIRLFNHEILTREEACRLLQDITRGRYNDTQIAALLTVFQMRGVKVDELIGFRDALLSTRIPVDLSAYQPIDIVGTGGDGKNTFNISTCACFVVAGAGFPGGEHGKYRAPSVGGGTQAVGVSFIPLPAPQTNALLPFRLTSYPSTPPPTCPFIFPSQVLPLISLSVILFLLSTLRCSADSTG